MPRSNSFILEKYKKAYDRVQELLRKKIYECAERTSVSHLNISYDVSHVFACCLQAATGEDGIVDEDLFLDLMHRRSEFE